MNTILFPSSFFNRKTVDEDLTKEYEAALNTGLYSIGIFDYNAWFNDDKLILNGDPESLTDAVYRGWMMKPEQYAAFYNNLLAHNIKLITSPQQYAKFHVFPEIYPKLKSDSVEMLIYDTNEQIDIKTVNDTFDRYMVKDYVKSVKGTSFPKFFTNNVTQHEFDEAMKLFYQYRGNLFTGGICIKEYVDLKLYGKSSNEFRCYYCNGEILSLSRNSLQPSWSNTPPKELIERYKLADSPLYTIDYAEKADGNWIIIEAGDGQVSGLSEKQNYESFFKNLHLLCNI